MARLAVRAEGAGLEELRACVRSPIRAAIVRERSLSDEA
jgi:hypothetical protein